MNIIKKFLYNSIDFGNIEYIFFNYIFSVGDIFENILTNNLDKYLENIKYIISVSIISIGLISMAYCLLFKNVLSKKLIHYLSISICVMKIIPTFVNIRIRRSDWK